MLTAIVILGLLAIMAAMVIVVDRRRTRPPGPRCPTCGGPAQNRGFLSWNGGASGLNVLTTGIAAPSESFVARLRTASAACPPGSPEASVRTVGALTLFECPACPATLVAEQGAGLRVCDPAQWRELTQPDTAA